MSVDFNKKTWGTYLWDDELTVAQNVSAASSANALIRTIDLQRIEDALAVIADSPLVGEIADIPNGAITQNKINGLATVLGQKLEDITGLITNGSNVTITGDGTDASPYTISASGGAAGADWGEIGGDLEDQEDLQDALNDKADASALAAKVNSIGGTVTGIWSGTQAEYELIDPKDASTYYIVVEDD